MTYKAKPLHSKQSEILIDQLFYLNSSHRNIGCTIKLYGSFEKEKFISSLNTLTSLYDVFRHEIKLIEGTYQNIFKNCATYSFKEIISSTQENHTSTSDIVSKDKIFNQKFQLEGSLIEVTLCKISKDEHWIFLSMHHLIMDGYSCELMIRSISKLYAGHEQLKNRTSYFDTLNNHETYLNSEKYHEDKIYWKNLLKGKERILHPPLVQNSETDLYKKQTKRTIFIDETRLRKWRDFAKRNNSGMQNITLLALKVLYSKFYRHNDFVIGIVTHGRNSIEKKSLGLYSSYLAVALDSSWNESVENTLKTITNQLRKHYRHLNFPISHLIRELDPKGKSKRMFDVVVNELTVDLNYNWGEKLECTIERELGLVDIPLIFTWYHVPHQDKMELEPSIRHLHFRKHGKTQRGHDRTSFHH